MELPLPSPGSLEIALEGVFLRENSPHLPFLARSPPGAERRQRRSCSNSQPSALVSLSVTWGLNNYLQIPEDKLGAFHNCRQLVGT